MAIVPALMVLYSNDAVEIRYSDGSRLELSPCGSSFIHVDPQNTGGYSRYGRLRKVHKRTRFVTSEHRHKVLQALDFRNRFAERSYLCDDLLSKEEILMLYAKIDNIAWPQKPGEAQIDVLLDGSRSITSLDEYATLVVSPHSQDFTVCFLSRISQDKRQLNNTAMQKSHSISHGASLKSSPSSSEKMCSSDSKYSSKLNQALVHPFEKSGHFDMRLPSNIDHSQVTNDLQELNFKNISSASQMKSDCLVSDNVTSQEVAAQNDSSEITKCNTEDNEQKSKLSREHSDNAESIYFIQNNETCSDKLISLPDRHCFNTDSVSNGKVHHALMPFSDDCPDPHDISSISRSSTPDGLRTTVDLNVTLLHNNLSGSFQRQMLDRRQRTNSPTQYTSSPYDADIRLLSEKSHRIQKQDVSLSGSFLGNQKIQSHHKESNGKTEMMYIECSNLGKDNSFSSTDNNSGRVTDNGCELETSVVPMKDPVSHVPHKPYFSNTTKCPSPKGNCPDLISNADKTLRTLYKPQDFVHLDEIDAGSDPTNSADNTAREIYFKAASAYIPFQTQADKGHGTVPLLKGYGLNECGSNREEHYNERQCKDHYMWTTKHCSTNDCPILWAHPLKLVLEGVDLTKEDLTPKPTKEREPTSPSTLAARESCVFTRVPFPLPVTCPFQHTHRWMSNDSGDEDEDSTTNMGEFQHGRFKVVVSEGVVYRLAQKAGVKIVEIYPGDGSVFVSHGVQGHFFTHYMPLGDQLQERTYSLKSLPHRQSQGKYSIKRLIEMANSLLLMNASCEQRNLKEEVPCWKKEVIAVVEPLSSSLLEECIVGGLGKFSAFTNGRVRIVFEDRTALDMVCDVSRRVQECFRHSQEPLVSLPCASLVSPPVPTRESIFGTSTVRLMLPSGEYITVDIKNPGPYRKYIDVAWEWTAWVRSSPSERQKFYANYNTPAILQQAVEVELRKISCFKYILEQTLLMQQQLSSDKSHSVTDSNKSDSVTNSNKSHSVTNSNKSNSVTNSNKSNSVTNSSIPTAQAADIPPLDTPWLQPVGCHKDTADPRQAPQPKLDPSLQGTDLRRNIRPTSSSLLTKSSEYLLSDRILPASSVQAGTGSPRNRSTDSTSAKVEFKSRNVENAVINFDSIRQALVENSKLISEVDQFLESIRRHD
ncbi:hypothetical protein BsWGS_03360 [Bradybaena similaris]